MLRAFLTVLLFVSSGLLAVPTAAQADETPQEGAMAQPTQPSAALQAKTAEALEDLRYKHLWIAYALIWMTVFVFMLRTYRIGRDNHERLELMKARLADLERKDG